MATSIKQLESEIDALQEVIDEALEILRDVYTPESTREDLAAGVGNAIDTLEEEETEEEDEGESSGE